MSALDIYGNGNTPGRLRTLFTGQQPEEEEEEQSTMNPMGTPQTLNQLTQNAEAVREDRANRETVQQPTPQPGSLVLVRQPDGSVSIGQVENQIEGDTEEGYPFEPTQQFRNTRPPGVAPLENKSRIKRLVYYYLTRTRGEGVTDEEITQFIRLYPNQTREIVETGRLASDEEVPEVNVPMSRLMSNQTQRYPRFAQAQRQQEATNDEVRALVRQYMSQGGAGTPSEREITAYIATFPEIVARLVQQSRR